MAAEVGCSASTIRRWESDGMPTGVRVDLLLPAVRAYGVDVDELARRIHSPA